MDQNTHDIVYCYTGCKHEYVGEKPEKEEAQNGGVSVGWTGLTNEIVVFLKWPLYCPRCRAKYTQGPFSHWCCEHPIDSGHIDFSNSSFRDYRPLEPHISVTHPRWCNVCGEARTRAILKNTQIKKTYKVDKTMPAHFQLVWKLGVRDGRMTAQTVNIEKWRLASAVDALLEIPRSLEPPAVEGDGRTSDPAGELIASMKRAKLESAKKITDDEWEAMILKTTMFDIRTGTHQSLAFKYQQGKIEGIDLQLRCEKAAMGMDGVLGREKATEKSLQNQQVSWWEAKNAALLHSSLC